MKKIKLIFLSFLLSFQLSAFDEFLVSDIRIIGLQRVSTGSIFNVIPISVGDRIDQRKSNDIVRSLFSTEQFDDIQIGKELMDTYHAGGEEALLAEAARRIVDQQYAAFAARTSSSVVQPMVDNFTRIQAVSNSPTKPPS